MLEKLNWFYLTGLITVVLLMWKWLGLLLRKNHILRSWGWLSLLNWIRTLTLSLLLIVPARKSKLKFYVVSFEVAAYLYKSILCPHMEYCCHFWAGARSHCLEILEELQKRICRTVGPSFACHSGTIGSLSKGSQAKFFL